MFPATPDQAILSQRGAQLYGSGLPVPAVYFDQGTKGTNITNIKQNYPNNTAAITFTFWITKKQILP